MFNFLIYLVIMFANLALNLFFFFFFIVITLIIILFQLFFEMQRKWKAT